MTPRFIALFACALSLAVACGSGDDQSAPEDAGGAPVQAGAPPETSGGSSATPGGSGGSGGSGVAPGGTGGGATSPGGAGGEPSMPAGGAPSGGAPSEPTEPGVSACGAQKYETGEGCAECPAPPSTDPTTLGCQNFSRAFNDNDEYLQLSFAQVPLHEPLGGTVILEWKDLATGTPDGTAEVTWTYSPMDEQFLVALPFEARYADWWRLGSWSFTDACGFAFTAPSLVVDYDGDAYDCLPPT